MKVIEAQQAKILTPARILSYLKLMHQYGSIRCAG